MKACVHSWKYLAEFFLQWEVFRTKFVQKIETHFVFSNFHPPPPEYRDFYKIMRKNNLKRGRPQMAIWRIRISCWIPKATNTHSQYVTLVVFSTTAMIAETRLNGTLYVHCMSLCFTLMMWSSIIRFTFGKWTEENREIIMTFDM